MSVEFQEWHGLRITFFAGASQPVWPKLPEPPAMCRRRPDGWACGCPSSEP